MKESLFFYDEDENIGGVEDILSYSHVWAGFTNSSDEYVEKDGLRIVSETLPKYAKKYHTWNPPVFCGGTLTESAIGSLNFILALMRVKIFPTLLGQRKVEVQDRKGEKVVYLLRPCRAEDMPLFLWRRWCKIRKRAIEAEESLTPSPRDISIPMVRRALHICFSLRKATPPKKVFFGKGTCYVTPPPGAVARIGSGHNDINIFLDRFARPIAAYRVKQYGHNAWAKEIPIPEKLEWWNIHPLTQGIGDILFGVGGK